MSRRLLIFTPTWTDANGNDAIERDCAAAILDQRIDGAVDWHIGRHNPWPIGDHRNVLAQYQQARVHFLAGDWDAILTVEQDNVLPDADAVAQMLDTWGDIIYAPYMLRHGMHILSLWTWTGREKLGQSLTYFPDELERARKVGTWRVCGTGFGATLFRRHVLEDIEFRAGAGAQHSPDLPFAEDAMRRGYDSIANLNVPVVHLEHGTRLHPYGEVGPATYQALETVTAIVAGERIAIERGERYELTPAQARDMAVLGWIVIPDYQSDYYAGVRA